MTNDRTDMLKCREEFEKWCAYYGHDLFKWEEEDEQYSDTTTQFMWRAWQAAYTRTPDTQAIQDKGLVEILENLNGDFEIGYTIEPYGLEFSKEQCRQMSARIKKALQTHQAIAQPESDDKCMIYLYPAEYERFRKYHDADDKRMEGLGYKINRMIPTEAQPESGEPALEARKAAHNAVFKDKERWSWKNLKCTNGDSRTSFSHFATKEDAFNDAVFFWHEYNYIPVSTPSCEDKCQ